MDKIMLEYTKGTGLKQVKCFHQDTIVFHCNDIEDFTNYILKIQSKEKVGIGVITLNQLYGLEKKFGDINYNERLEISENTKMVRNREFWIHTLPKSIWKLKFSDKKVIVEDCSEYIKIDSRIGDIIENYERENKVELVELNMIA